MMKNKVVIFVLLVVTIALTKETISQRPVMRGIPADVRGENITRAPRIVQKPEGIAGGPDIKISRENPEHDNSPAIRHGENADKEAPRFVAPETLKK